MTRPHSQLSAAGHHILHHQNTTNQRPAVSKTHCRKCGRAYSPVSLQDGCCVICRMDIRRDSFVSELGLECAQEVI
jgi:methionyl-tRNA synthetase